MTERRRRLLPRPQRTPALAHGGGTSAWLPVRRISTTSTAAWALAAAALIALGTLPVSGFVAWPALILGASAACAVPIFGAARRGRVNPFELGVAVSIAYFVLFPLRATVLLLHLDPAANQGALVAPTDIRKLALATAACGLLAVGLAYNARLPARLGKRLRLPKVEYFEHAPTWLGLVLFVPGLIAESLLIAANNDENTANAIAAGGRLSSIVSGASIYMIVGLCILTRGALLGRRRRDYALVAAAAMAVMALSLLGRFKEPAIIGFLAISVTHTFTRGTPNWRRVGVVALAVVYLVFPLVQGARHVSIREGTKNPAVIVRGIPSELRHYDLRTGIPRRLRPWTPVTEPVATVSNRLYSYDSMILSVWYTPAVVPYQHGRMLALVGAGLMPRLLWPGKPPTGLGNWFARNYWNTPQEVTEVPQAIGHPGEFWIDFGFAGVVIGLAMLAAFYRFLFAALRPADSGTGVVLYAVVFVTVLDVDRDLPLVYVTLGQRLAVVGAIMVALGFMNWVRRRFQHSGTASAVPHPGI